MLALPSNPDSYELGIRFFFFFAEFFYIFQMKHWCSFDELESNMPT